MQILLEVINPNPIKLFFVYERAHSSNEDDLIDTMLISFGQEISEDLSPDSFNITKYKNVNLDNFSRIGYPFEISTKIEFKYSDENGKANKKVRTITVYHDGFEEYVANRLKKVNEINVTKEHFDLIDTLTTSK